MSRTIIDLPSPEQTMHEPGRRTLCRFGLVVETVAKHPVARAFGILDAIVVACPRACRRCGGDDRDANVRPLRSGPGRRWPGMPPFACYAFRSLRSHHATANTSPCEV